MQLLQPGKYNLMTAAGSTGGGGGSGGGGVPASIPENTIQTAAARTDGTNRTNGTNGSSCPGKYNTDVKTDRARPGHLENKTSAWVYSCSLTTAWVSKSGMGIALADI
jgi:hypothetical protein